MDQYKVIVHPLNTESAMKKIEENNTLVFIVDLKANKRQIKQAVKKLYDVDAVKINTLIRCVMGPSLLSEQDVQPGNSVLYVNGALTDIACFQARWTEEGVCSSYSRCRCSRYRCYQAQYRISLRCLLGVFLFCMGFLLHLSFGGSVLAKVWANKMVGVNMNLWKRHNVSGHGCISVYLRQMDRKKSLAGKSRSWSIGVRDILFVVWSFRFIHAVKLNVILLPISFFALTACRTSAGGPGTCDE